MKEISILLPSLRPCLVKTRIRDFELTNPSINYELVIVSPFQVEGHNVKWIKDSQAKEGSVWATNVAYQNSESELVVYFSDDVIPTKNCLEEMLKFMYCRHTPFIGAFKMVRDDDREIGAFRAYGNTYACYGCISKKNVDKIGGFFDTNLLYSWADIDISLRCWQAGGRVEVCHNAIVSSNQVFDDIYIDHRERTWQSDVKYFLDKWHPILGKNLPKEASVVNNPKGGIR